MKRCRKCGTTHTREGWEALRLIGQQADGEGGALELRHCLCGSTVAVEIPAETLVARPC